MISDKAIKFIKNTMKNWKEELTVGGKSPERYISGRCTITITICDSDDTSQSHI